MEPQKNSPVDLWASFLAHEKLQADWVGPDGTLKLMDLCRELARREGDKMYPVYRSHKDRIIGRRKVCEAAMDMGLDLLSLTRPKHQGRGRKPAIGRGLLDVWNEVYKERFGDTRATPGAVEVIRRKVSGNVSEVMKEPI